MPSAQLSPLQKAAVTGGYGAGPIKPCAVCGSRFRVCCDHIVPRAQGGTNAPDNLQPLCEPCNLWKGGRHTNDELVAWYTASRDAIECARAFRYGVRHRDGLEVRAYA